MDFYVAWDESPGKATYTYVQKYNGTEHIPSNMHMIRFCCDYIIISLWIHMIHLPIFFRVTSLALGQSSYCRIAQDDVIKWEHFPRYWPCVSGIHSSPVNSFHRGQWRRALMFSLICTWTYGWVNIRDAGDLRRHRDHYDVTVMQWRHHKRFGQNRLVPNHNRSHKVRNVRIFPGALLTNK